MNYSKKPQSKSSKKKSLKKSARPLPPVYTKIEGYKTETKVVKHGDRIVVVDKRDGQTLAAHNLATGRRWGITEYFPLLDKRIQELPPKTSSGLTEEAMLSSLRSIRDRLEKNEIDKADALNEISDLSSVYEKEKFAYFLPSLGEDDMDTADLINAIDDFTC